MTMDQLIFELGQIVGPSHVLTDTDMARYSSDWLNQYQWQPRAILRPATAEQVSEVVKLANRMKIPLVPMGGEYRPCRGHLRGGGACSIARADGCYS